MKKIISILAVFAMVFACCGTVALAAEQTITLSTDETTYNAGDEFELYIEGDTKCAGFGIVVDFDEELFELVDDEETDGYLFDLGAFEGDVIMNPDGKANCFSVGGIKTKNASIDASVTIKVKEDAPSGSFTFNAVSVGPKSNVLLNGTTLDVIVEPAEEITIVGAGPVVTTVTPTEATLTAVADAMIEKGQAVAMTFKAGDIKDYAGMNWKVDFASGTKYAKVDYPAATIAGLGATTPVQFVAAFLVYDRGYEAVDEISGVAAGFCNADKELAGLTATVEVE